MVVQALILPTLSVPILIGNQALCDHFYANVPGSLDFSFGEHTRVDCKAIKYEVVRQHCIADSSALASTVSTAGEPIPEFSEKLGCPRPPGFPPTLWKYVSPFYRHQAQEVFSRYTPERLDEVLMRMANLDVYQGDTPRGQRTLAQAYYNLDAYFHPIADQPPVVTGTEFTIETSREIPRVNRHKRLSAVQKASVEARVRRMMRQGQLQPSKSPISLGIVLVEYPDRIRKFISEHGESADAARLDPQHESEVAAFYRLTVDLRPVNEVTVPDMFPLPRLLDLLDSALDFCVLYYRSGGCIFYHRTRSRRSVQDRFFNS